MIAFDTLSGKQFRYSFLYHMIDYRKFVIFTHTLFVPAVGVATTAWKLLKAKFYIPNDETHFDFLSDESPGRTRSAHVACAQ